MVEYEINVRAYLAKACGRLEGLYGGEWSYHYGHKNNYSIIAYHQDKRHRYWYFDNDPMFDSYFDYIDPVGFIVGEIQQTLYSQKEA